MVKDGEGVPDSFIFSHTVPQHLGTQEVDEGIAYVGASEPMLGGIPPQSKDFATMKANKNLSVYYIQYIHDIA